MEWIYVIFAGVLEMFGVDMMNRWQVDRRKRVLVWMFLSFGISLRLLALAMETLPMSTAYAVWTGIGAVGGAAVGILKYGEDAGARRVFFIALILVSAVGLKLTA